MELESLTRRIKELEAALDRVRDERDAARQLARSLRAGQDRLPLGLIHMDRNGRIETVNRAMAEICPRSGDLESRGAPLLEMECMQEPLREAVRALLERGESFDLEASPDAAFAGDGRLIRFQGLPLQDPEGRPGGYLLMAEDASSGAEDEGHLQTSLDRLRRLFLGTVDAMSSMVERRDPFVSGHQKRVAQLAVAIAEELGSDAFTVEGIRITGLLHDLGKVAIPAEILCKPGELSRAEQSIVRTHPVIAHRLLKRVEFPWPVADAILQHQERMDGTGYPAGLKGREILIQARILAVADTVEAMLTRRPYRQAHPLEVVLAELEHHKGGAYDAAVVDACLRLFREKGFEFRSV
ncbi:MAG: HD domain-containing protein [Candidatus Krumholzibacteriota bacterium]|nr:HD domain-containing protein [Candidatus Krumholzibacteriota bacterium]